MDANQVTPVVPRIPEPTPEQLYTATGVALLHLYSKILAAFGEQMTALGKNTRLVVDGGWQGRMLEITNDFLQAESKIKTLVPTEKFVGAHEHFEALATHYGNMARHVVAMIERSDGGELLRARGEQILGDAAMRRFKAALGHEPLREGDSHKQARGLLAPASEPAEKAIRRIRG